MTRHAIVAAVALSIAAGCTGPRPTRQRGADLRAPSGRLSDTVEYRRLCVVAVDSAVDVRKPCVLRDQSPRIP